MRKEKPRLEKWISIIDIVIEYGLYCLVFFIPTSISGINIFSGLLFIIYIIRLIYKQDQDLWKSKLSKFLLLFAVVSLLSVFWANDKYRTIRFFVSPLLKYLLIYYLIINYITTEKKFKKIFKIYWLSHIISAGYAIYNYYFLGIKRTSGFTHNPNRLGAIMMMFIIVNFSIALFKENGFKTRLISISGIVIGFLALFSTASRGALIGLILSLFVISILKDWKILIYLLIGLLILGMFIPEYYKNRIFKLTDLESNNVKSRIAMYKAGIDLFRQNPILGIGLNNVRTVYDTYDLNEFDDFGGNHRNLHNLFINILVELGIIGFFVFVMILINIFKKGWSNYINNKSWFNVSLLGVLVGEGFHNMVDFTFHASEVSLIVFLFFGLMIINAKLQI